MKQRVSVSLAVALVSMVLVGAAEGKTSRHNTSWYGVGDGSGSHTASGMRFNAYNPHIVAHKSYKFGTRLLLTNNANGRTLCGVVEDRGPFVSGREYDVTYAGAKKLGFSGVAQVSSREQNCHVPEKYLNPKRR